MLYLMKTEWKKVRLPVLAVTLLLTVTACILTCTLYKDYILEYNLDAWEIGTELISFLFPLFVVLPLCWNLYYERKDRFLLYVLPRVPQRKYLTAKWLVHALCSFFILFIPYLLSALCALYVNAPVVPYKADVYVTPFDHVFLETYTKLPLVYALCLSCWRGLLGILVMTFGYLLSMYVKNIFVILTGPFIYVFLESFILAILGLFGYSLVVAFDPTAYTIITVCSFFVGPILLAAVIILIALCFTKVLKKTVVTI